MRCVRVAWVETEVPCAKAVSAGCGSGRGDVRGHARRVAGSRPQGAAAVGEAGSPLAAGPVTDNPVSLADAQEFDAPAPEVGQAEIAEARRTLASAASSEKFMDGATAVLMAYLIYLVAF